MIENPGASAVIETSAIPAAERAYVYAKALIIRGDLAGGELISEGQICEALGVSRTPVHEAFLRLAAEQMLVLSSRKGAVVAPISPREAQDVLEMRQAIEIAAAARIIREGGPDARTLTRLRDNLGDQRVAVAADDADAFVTADDRFHFDIIEAGNNAIAVHLFGQLRDRQQRLRVQLLRMSSPRQREALEDHAELANRLAARDLPGFTAVLATHLERHRDAL